MLSRHACRAVIAAVLFVGMLPALAQDAHITLRFNSADVLVLDKALAAIPLNQAYPAIDKIQKQIDAQGGFEWDCISPVLALAPNIPAACPRSIAR